jgi:uncharacterized protein YqjF (DUF2071 family)
MVDAASYVIRLPYVWTQQKMHPLGKFINVDTTKRIT